MAAHAKKGGSPCFTCAYFRRAATNRRAQELGFNKVALAHHNDDAVETFFMNLVTSGQLRTFLAGNAAVALRHHGTAPATLLPRAGNPRAGGKTWPEAYQKPLSL